MNYCNDCALRLFNKKCYNLQPVGTYYYGNAIVLPNVDYNAYNNKNLNYSSQIEIIDEIATTFSTGGVKSNSMIIPLIRCNEHIGCEINDDIIKRCMTYLTEDIKKYDFKRIMLCGDAARRFLNIDDIASYLNTVILDNKNLRAYFVNYNPLVKYKDANKFELFKKYLQKYMTLCIDKMLFYEKVIYI